MAEPNGPVNGQSRVAEGLVTAAGTVGWKRGATPTDVAGSAYDALNTVVEGTGTAGVPAGGVHSVQGVPSGTPMAVSTPGLAGGIQQTITTVGATAAAVPATPLAGRATLLVQNVGATTIYLGKSTVTADTAATGGIQLLPGQSIPISLSAAVILYAISSAASGKVATFEVAA